MELYRCQIGVTVEELILLRSKKILSHSIFHRLPFVSALLGMFIACLLTGTALLPKHASLLYIPDHTYILTDARMMLDHASLFFNHSIGFPVGADRYYFPRPDYLPLLTLWLGTVLTNDVFAAVHFYYVITSALIFLCCFLAMRWLDISLFSAFIVSLAYCLLPYAASRFSYHDYLEAYYCVPLGAALAMNIARVRSQGTLLKTLSHTVAHPFVVISIILVSWSGVYYAFYSIFFIGLAGVFIGASNRRSAPFIVAITTCTMILGLLCLGLLPYLLHGAPFPIRGASDQYGAAIRIPDILLPFTIFPYIDKVYDAYTHSVRPSSEGADFWPGRLLSLIVLSSPFIMAIRAQQRQYVTRPKSAYMPAFEMITLAATLISAAILFGLPESYGYLFNMLFTGSIRAQNRAGVFVAFFALIIAVQGLACLREKFPKLQVALCTVFLTLVAINAKPQLLYAFRANRDEQNNQVMQQNIVAINAILSGLHSNGANAVLQLPIAGWPEVPNISSFIPGEHLWFYIYDQPKSPIVWSYGIDWHMAAFPVLKKMGETLDAHPELATWQPFRCLGFDAVIIEKTAYSEMDIKRYELSVKQLGFTKLHDDARRMAFMLSPMPRDNRVCPKSPEQILSESL